MAAASPAPGFNDTAADASEIDKSRSELLPEKYC
jgi:hypothetical protein